MPSIKSALPFRRSMPLALLALLTANSVGRPSQSSPIRLLRTGKSKPKKGARRLPMATGPGSINCKAEVYQAIQRHDLYTAHTLAIKHRQQCGERLYPRVLFMIEGRP